MKWEKVSLSFHDVIFNHLHLPVTFLTLIIYVNKELEI